MHLLPFLAALSLFGADLAVSPANAAVQAGAAGASEWPSEAEALAFVHAYSPSDLRRAAELNMLRKDFVPALRKDPGLAAMLSGFPALGPAVVAAMESQIDLYMSEYDARFVPKAREIARHHIPRADLLALTAFYRSPLGRKILRTAADTIDGAEVAEKGLKQEKVDEGVANRQLLKSGWAVLGRLTPDERTQFLAFVNSPAGQTFESVRPRFTALQMELMNSPSPKFVAASEKAMMEAITRVTGIDPRKAK